MVVLVGDRGILTEARIREEVAPAGLEWISALRFSAIRQLLESGAVQMSLFDQTDLQWQGFRQMRRIRAITRKCSSSGGNAFHSKLSSKGMETVVLRRKAW